MTFVADNHNVSPELGVYCQELSVLSRRYRAAAKAGPDDLSLMDLGDDVETLAVHIAAFPVSSIGDALAKAAAAYELMRREDGSMPAPGGLQDIIAYSLVESLGRPRLDGGMSATDASATLSDGRRPDATPA